MLIAHSRRDSSAARIVQTVLHFAPFRSLKFMYRVGSVLTLVVCAPLAAQPRDVFALIQTSCAGCHNSTVKSGDLDLAALKLPKTFEEHRETWEKVVDKLKLGQIPPPGVPRPPADTVTAVTRWLESEFARQDRLVRP